VTSRARLMERPDRLLSRLVRAEVGRCEVCGAEWGPLQAMHVVSRSHVGLRWRRDNVVCGCVPCHQAMTDRPAQWEAWCRASLGDDTVDELRLEARLGGKAGELFIAAETARLVAECRAAGL